MCSLSQLLFPVRAGDCDLWVYPYRNNLLLYSIVWDFFLVSIFTVTTTKHLKWHSNFIAKLITANNKTMTFFQLRHNKVVKATMLFQQLCYLVKITVFGKLGGLTIPKSKSTGSTRLSTQTEEKNCSTTIIVKTDSRKVTYVTN